MAQKKIKINDEEIFQPDKGMTWSFETTHTSGSTRSQDGVAHITEMFTVEQFSYKANNVPVAEGKKILNHIIGKKFSLYCFSPYYGKWRTDKFYVGKGDLTIGTLKDGDEEYESISFNATGINPLKEE